MKVHSSSNLGSSARWIPSPMRVFLSRHRMALFLASLAAIVSGTSLGAAPTAIQLVAPLFAHAIVGGLTIAFWASGRIEADRASARGKQGPGSSLRLDP
jgi:hypothetical protein